MTGGRVKKYTSESISRALQHHEGSGAVEFTSPPGQGQPKWRIRLRHQETIELTEREAYIVCLALRAAETNDPAPDENPAVMQGSAAGHAARTDPELSP